MKTVINQAIKRTGIVFFCFWSFIQVQAQSSALDVVQNWGNCLKNYVENDNIESRIQLDEITPPNCLVNDAVAQRIANEKGYPAGTLRVADYYNAMEKWKAKGKFSVFLEYLEHQEKVCTPGELSILGDTLHVVMGRLGMKGSIDFADRVMFFVRGKKITKIISTGDGETLGKAIEFYTNKDYDNAFMLFRKLANLDRSNYMAQYYTAVMLLNNEGCQHIHPIIRKQEAIWWLLRGCDMYAYFLKDKWVKYRKEKRSNISYNDFIVQFGEDLKQNHSPEALKLMVMLYDTLKVSPNDFPLLGRNDYRILVSEYKPINKGLIMKIDLQTGFHGFVNENNEQIIPCKYKITFPFGNNGLALVYNDEGKKGYINTKGEIVIPCIYDNAIRSFIGDVTFVLKDNDLLVINEKNEILRKISGYKEMKYMPSLDKYIIIQDPNTKQMNMFDTMGNIIAYDVDGLNSDLNGIFKVTKDGAIIYSCYMNWR